MSRILVSTRIEEDLWREIKIHAIKKGMTVADFMEDLIRKELTGQSQEILGGRSKHDDN